MLKPGRCARLEVRISDPSDQAVAGGRVADTGIPYQVSVFDLVLLHLLAGKAQPTQGENLWKPRLVVNRCNPPMENNSVT